MTMSELHELMKETELQELMKEMSGLDVLATDVMKQSTQT